MVEKEEKRPEPHKDCTTCGFSIVHHPAKYFGYPIECTNSREGKELDYWCTSWKPKEKTKPEPVNPSEPLYPKVVYQLGSDSKEYIELKKKCDKLIEVFKDKLEFLRDKVLEAPILSGSVQDLRDHIHDLKDLVIKNINEYEGVLKT